MDECKSKSKQQEKRSMKVECFEEADDLECETSLASNTKDISPPKPSVNPDTLVAMQSYNGEFEFKANILQDLAIDCSAFLKSKGIDNNTLMTLVVVAWLKKYFNSPKFNLIVNKSIIFLKSKNVSFKDVETEISQYLK